LARLKNFKYKSTNLDTNFPLKPQKNVFAQQNASDLQIKIRILDTDAGSFVGAESVAVGTAALVASGRVLAHADAQVSVLELFALVDVVARPAVALQGESRVARAPERAPVVQTRVLTQTGTHAALVDV